MGDSEDGAGHNRASANGHAAPRRIDDLAPGCQRLLENAGFTFDPRIGAWFNLANRRVLALDRPAAGMREWLAGWLARS